jgi:hypothetical protein
VEARLADTEPASPLNQHAAPTPRSPGGLDWTESRPTRWTARAARPSNCSA